MQQLPGAALSRCLRGSTAQFTQHRCCVRPQPWARGVARSPVERASRCAGRSEAHMTVIASSGNRRFRAVGSGGGATTFPRDTFAVARAALLMICASRRQQQHARSPTAATGYRGRRDVAAAASAEGAGGEASSASHDVRDDKEFTAAVNRLLRRIVVAACVALPVLSAAYGALRGGVTGAGWGFIAGVSILVLGALSLNTGLRFYFSAGPMGSWDAGTDQYPIR